MRKKFSILAIILLLVGFIAACNKDESANEKKDVVVNKEGFPIVNEKIELEIFGPNVGVAKWEDMKFFKVMEEKTNIKFKFNTPPLDSFDTQKNLVFASNELPDIFYGASLTNSDVVKYSQTGQLIPLDDLIEEYAPNVKRMFEEYPDVKKTITAPDGHIYTLPALDRNLPWNIHPMWYNGHFLEALGVTELPTTPEELIELLRRFKNEDPNGNGEQDEIPLTAQGMWDIRQWFMGFFGLKSIAQAQYDGVIKYGAVQPEFKEYLQFMNQLWEEGLLDPETFSQTGEQKAAKGKANRVGLFANWGPGMFLGEEESTKHPMMQPIKGPNVDKPVIPISPGQSINQFAISNTNPYPEATMRWIDYSYSEEGYAFLHGLDEGDVWVWADEAKTKRKMIEGGEEKRGTMTPAYGIPVPAWAHEEYVKSFYGEYEEFRDKETQEKILKYGEVALPQLFLLLEELDEIAGINADIIAYVEQMEAKFITGAESFDKWDEYVKTAEEIGVDKIVKVYQKAYDRYMESQ